MDTKKYFDDPQTIVSSTNIDSLTKEVESHRYVAAYVEEKERFVPRIDFSSASNFTFFGSAEQYYKDAIKKIYQTYPYDGSLYEKTAWHLSSSYLENYIFNNEYPRTNGFIRLSAKDSADPWVGSASGDYYSASAAEYILFRGGPHPSTRSKGKEITDTAGTYKSGYSNVLDQANNRESNLKIDGAKGNTVEFWMKKTATEASTREVIFDTYTANATETEAGYGRMAIEIFKEGSEDTVFNVTYISGSSGFQTASIGQGINSNFSDDSWHHYGFTFANSGSNLQAKLYVDGQCNNIITGSEDNLITEPSSATIDYVSGGMYATVGALATSPRGNSTPQLGWAPLSASIDEFRFWKTKRNAQQIGRHWFTQVGGGTNTDDANTHLGAYYKFNEGITGETSLDSILLDYSGRINNGTWIGYTSGHRSTGSAILLSNLVTASFEFKDPILYSTHSDVNAYYTSSIEKGRHHDLTNNASIYNSMPAWVIDDDGENGEILKKLTQIMASYFDTLQLQIQELPTLQNVAYPSGSYEKPYSFIKDALESKGFITSELFADADILAQFLNQSENELFEKKLYHVKNQIYQNIYNSLTNIYKTKGTEKSIRNLIRCFGLDHELIKLNLYANESDYELENNFSSVTVKKNCVDFNRSGRTDGTIYQFSSSTNANSVSFISGSAPEANVDIPFTVESEIIFPNNGHPKDKNYFLLSSLTSSLFGMHTARQASYEKVPSSPTDYNDLAWHVNDAANFQVYAGRKTLAHDNLNSNNGFTNKDAFFTLTSSQEGFALELTSSVFKNVYDDNKWNFAVRVVPTKYPLAKYISGSLSQRGGGTYLDGVADTANHYKVEFYGVNTDLDVISNEFLLTASLSYEKGRNFLSSSKRMYAGASRTNFTGSALYSTDIKFSSLKCWLDYIDDDTIQAHSRDPKNIGRLNPYKPAYLFEAIPIDGENEGSTRPYVPQMETLILNWDFTGVTGSNNGNSNAYYAAVSAPNSASFHVHDMSSGSAHSHTNATLALTSSYGAVSEIVGLQYTGKADFLPQSNKKIISKEYIYAARQNMPENAHSSDTIKIAYTDDVVFTKNIRPSTNFFAIEKSMYQTISEEILRFFATIKDFNNLIGEPVNRYRQDYKALSKLRQLFFERKVEDDGATVYPDLEKYIDYYKWVDQSISKMIQQVVPASARFSDDIRNMIESHILERNKYWSKLPIVEEKTKRSKEDLSAATGGNQGDDNLAYGIAPPIPMHSVHPAAVGGGFIQNNLATANPQRLSTGAPTRMQVRLRTERSDWSANDENSNTVAWTNTDRTEEATASPAGGNSYRQLVLDAVIATKLNTNRTPYNTSMSANKPIAGGINTVPNQKPTLFKTIINNVATEEGQSENVGLEITDQKEDETAILKEFREVFLDGSKKRESLKSSRSPNYPTSDSYSKQFTPFTIMSSSVNTGYNSVLSSKFAAGVDFSNLHRDIYAPHYETPMQGPFTEKWVGGFPYRHVWSQFQEHGFTPDSTSTRVEGWNIEFKSDATGKYIVFRSPISASVHNPRAIFWTGPKRPVNIENIQIKTGSGGFQDPTGSTKIGNYRFDYNIISTTGRKINNRYFVENNGIDIEWYLYQKPNSTNLPIKGVSNFTAINRFVTGSNDFVFVNKFSAPGGPESMCETFFDLESGEYSPYDTVNYRNLLVREPLKEYLTNHSNQFGYFSDAQYSASWQTAIDDGLQAAASYAGNRTLVNSDTYVGEATSAAMASFHKVNRNPLKTIKLEAASRHSVITGNVYDNYWVQHPIPRTDIQYSWISASLLTGYSGSALYGYERRGTNDIRRYSPQASTDLTFISASEITISGLSVDFAGTNTLINDPVNASLNLLSASTGDYRNTNLGTLTQPDDLNSLILHRQGPYGWPSWKQTRQGKHPIARREKRESMLSFMYDNKLNRHTESLATSRFKPMVHVFKGSTVQHTYGNNLASFANVEVREKLKSELYGGTQTYDSLKDIYLEDVISWKPSLLSLYYKEMLYPKEINVYLEKARMRKNYVVDFWRETRSDRTKTSVTNSQGQTIPQQSVWALDARENFATADARGKSDSAGDDGAGELLNNYTIYHGGTDVIIPAACYVRPLSASANDGDLSTRILYGDTLWEAGDPFYDSYDDYSNEIRRSGQNYSIVSEFRMSEHMEYFLDEKNGNFFADREGFLTCTGSNYADSTVDNFFKTYSHSDFLKYFSVVYEDHKGVIEPSRVSLTCNAVMKLLPYKGFYPADRTLQLATLFSQSYGSTEFTSGSYSNNAKRRISLAPFFAPGILYNSIKSGMAVDYPIYTKQPGSSAPKGAVTRTIHYFTGSSGSAATSNVYRLSSSFDYRLPFDSLVRPETYIGNGSYIYEAEPDPTARLSGSSATTIATGSVKLDLVKSDTYKLAMHNFLATSIDLFLKNGELSTLISKQSDEYTVVPRVLGGAYKMRIYLTDHQDVSGSNTNARNFSMYNRQTAFGPAVNAPDNKGGYAPFTPPYYYNDSTAGYSYVEYSFAPWKHTIAERYGTEGTDIYNLDEIVSNATITEYRSADNSQLSSSTASGTNYVQDVDMMQLTASINLFQKGDKFIAQTRFETPILNFTNVTKTSPNTGDASTKGLWHQKGVYETDNSKGIFFGATDVEGAASLADLLGIDKGFKKIGLLPDDDEKVIREAVVAIPVLKKINRSGQVQTKFINISKKHAKWAISDILDSKTQKESRASASVYNTINAMRRYVIPPQFDFVTQLKKFGIKKFKPFAMYIFEFEHQLKQEELASIWQNIQPEIAQTFKKEKATICHQLKGGELLTSTELSNPDLHWMIFKVKQKAKWNYFDKAMDLVGKLPPVPNAGARSIGEQSGLAARGRGERSLEDPLQRSKDNTTRTVVIHDYDKVTTSTSTAEDEPFGLGLDYSYNWPYDFCSLVELINVDAEVHLGGKGEIQVHPPKEGKIENPESLGEKEETIVTSNKTTKSVSSEKAKEEANAGTTTEPDEEASESFQFETTPPPNCGEGFEAVWTGTEWQCVPLPDAPAPTTISGYTKGTVT